MLHSSAVGQTSVGNKPDIILATEVERKPVNHGLGKQYNTRDILSRVLFLPRPGGPLVYIRFLFMLYLPFFRFHVNAA